MQSEDLKQQQQRDAATILELTKRADGLQRQLGAQEKVMRIQEEALQKAMCVKGAHDENGTHAAEAQRLDNVLSSPAHASAAHGCVLRAFVALARANLFSVGAPMIMCTLCCVLLVCIAAGDNKCLLSSCNRKAVRSRCVVLDYVPMSSPMCHFLSNVTDRRFQRTVRIESC